MFSYLKIIKNSLFIICVAFFAGDMNAYADKKITEPNMTMQESIEKLNSSKKDDKINALNNINMRGKKVNAKALNGVMDAANDADAEVKLRAINTLGGIGQNAKRSTPMLMKMLGDKDENVRKSAAAALKNIGSRKGILAAQELYPDEKKRRYRKH